MLDLAVGVLYLAALAAAGRMAARRAKGGVADYVLAGRALTTPAFVATLVPSFYGGALGVGEFTWTNGLSNWVVMAAPYYVFSLLYAAFLAGRIRLNPGLTMADHIEGVYGRTLAVVCAALVFLLASPSDELLALGTLVADVARVPVWAGAGAAAVFVVLVLLRGGLRADVAVNTVQFGVMFVGFAALLPFAAAKLGGPSKLAGLLPPGHLSPTGGMTPLRLVAWWLIAVWTIVDPVFHQRCAAAATPAVARRGIVACVGFWALFDLMTTTAGLYARAALPTLDQPMLAYPRLAAAVLPAGAYGLFIAALASSLLAGLQAQALQSSISLGKDGVGRWLRADERNQRRLTTLALVVSVGLGLVLAAAIPSVVGLWYAIGSAVIPGLLLPLLGVYFSRVRAPRRWALAASIGGFGVSTAWLAAQQKAGAAPFGVDPMFPGLAVSGALWSAGLALRSHG